MEIKYTPIGIIHTPFTNTEGMPIQPVGAVGVQGNIEIFPAYTHGLKDLAGFSHIILLYHFHRSTAAKLLVTPFMDDELRGVFATRAPKRPNAIGFSVVKLIEVAGNQLRIGNIDVVDATPLLDIKPYIPEDIYPISRIGWLEKARGKMAHKKSDNRFH